MSLPVNTENPLALLIGMVLDQQIPLEVAFRGPKTIADRMAADRFQRVTFDQLTDKVTGILERIVHGADDHILMESPPMVACSNPFADVTSGEPVVPSVAFLP